MRRRDRLPVVAREGDMVIDGRLRARLLGLPLLDIDAHVVVAMAPPRPQATISGRRERHRRPLPSNGSVQPTLTRAVRLLAEGSTALDDARRIRRLASETTDR
jgi:hypothetical protein